MPAGWIQEVHSNGQVGRMAYDSQVVEKPLDQLSFRDVDRCNEQQHHGRGRLRQVSVQTVVFQDSWHA